MEEDIVKSINKLRDKAKKLQDIGLRKLLQDEERSKKYRQCEENITVDYSRQFIDKEIFNELENQANKYVYPKIYEMYRGEDINTTEKRGVLHIALRASENDKYIYKDKDIVKDVINVRKYIKEYSTNIRNGTIRSINGNLFKNTIVIGIGGSYLGTKYVHEALRSDLRGGSYQSSKGRILRFLSNVDPVDFTRSIQDLNPNETLIIIVSKTFTTTETMLNAKLCRNWIVTNLGEKAIPYHMIAVSTDIDKVKSFGIDKKNIFPFWNWVGGRYSVTSSVGILPLSIQYGYDIIENFLNGARTIDQHFYTKPFNKNIPILLGMIGFQNSTILEYPVKAIIPYSEALVDFPNHIQQVDMESNGKNVRHNGKGQYVKNAGEIVFGQSGTNGQHSFYQLLHQGRTVPIDFIGSIYSQYNQYIDNNILTLHDELMSNFFAQPDALALGCTYDELLSNNTPKNLLPHKFMPGNRPSTMILFQQITAYEVGQLLAIYEHRTAVQGFLWDINSFDQFGVELGKILAVGVKHSFTNCKVCIL